MSNDSDLEMDTTDITTYEEQIEPYKSLFGGCRFLIVLGSFAGMGGAERQALLLGEFLKQRIGADVVFLASSGGDLLEAKLAELDIEYVISPFGEKANRREKITQCFRLLKVIRALKVDFIIPFISYNSKIVGLIWKYTGAQYALWNQRDEGRGLFGSRLERFTLQNVKHIVSNSVAGRDALVNKCGLNPEDVTIINNGIQIPDSTQLKRVWREKLGLPPETLTVSMIANLSYYKDHATLLRAWQKVERHFANLQKPVALILAGAPKKAADGLKILAFDLRLRNVFMPGRVEDVPTLINDCDLVVHSSLLEGCPNGVLEAMALGKPIVGTDIPGIRQALGNRFAEECMCMPSDPDDLARLMISFLNDKARRSRIGNANRQRIEEEFSIEKMVCSYLSLIRESMDIDRFSTTRQSLKDPVLELH